LSTTFSYRSTCYLLYAAAVQGTNLSITSAGHRVPAGHEGRIPRCLHWGKFNLKGQSRFFAWFFLTKIAALGAILTRDLVAFSIWFPSGWHIHDLKKLSAVEAVKVARFS
jgi:hypothetical protein